MPLPEHRVLEQNRNQDNGEPSAQPLGVELQAAIRADLLQPVNWQEGLATFARATNLAVALADAAGRLIGSTINPRPTWSLLHSKTPPIASPSAGGVGCPFSLARLQPCNCVADALARGGVVVARDRTGLVHFAVPLVLGGHPLGALVAGQVFTQYPEQLQLEHIARQLLLSPPEKVWELACLEHPVKQATLEVYADLLATLGQTFLQTRDHSLREAELLSEMTRLRDHAMAEATQRKRVEESQHFLAEVSVEFTSLDYETTLNNLAHRAVPFLADFCFFDVVTPDERIQRVAWALADPAKQELFDKFCRLVPALNFKDRPVAKALLTGHPDFEPEITDAWMQAAATSPQHLQFMRDLGLSSMMAVPLVAHERNLGALTFCCTAASGRRYAQRELRLAEELARRTAMVVENAKLYHALQDADRRKDEFLATLAHELRGPLAPLSNMLEVMKRADGNSDVMQDARSTMERQLGQMIRLVDDLLDVNRISRGKLDLHRERVELASVLYQAVEDCRPAVELAEHELTVTPPPRAVYLHADPARLAQVFDNLLNNACKYTERGGHISLTAEQQGADVAVSVKDTGVGIPPDMLPKIFEIFTQVDQSLERSQGGLGIGLTLVQRLVEMHGGSVKAFSEGPGRGSEFVVRLPVLVETPKVQRPAEPKVQQPAEPADGEPTTPTARRILVVDDNLDSAASLAALLKLTGNDTQIAHDGLEAVEAAATFKPDVVLLDIGLPKLNGYDACRKIREQPWGKDMVLIALTGWGQDEDRRKSHEAGFSGHLVKPLQLAALMNLLAELQPTPV